ncbi:MAG: hypothetical protein WAU42_04355, partial [Solirubrobacteraceae bacterium]
EPDADPPPARALARGETRRAAEPPGTAENLVGACVSLVHTRLLQDGGGSFLDFGPSLMGMIVHPYLGPRAAKRELGRAPVSTAKGPAERDSDRPIARVRERSY